MRPDLDATALASAVRSGELRAREVVGRLLERARAVEPQVGAFLRFFEDVLDRATEIDARRRGGVPLGALAGVPVAIKDNLAVAGQPLTCASRILEGYVSPFSATVVERLLAADAILVGATNLDEFAMGSSCETSAFQTTRNPWDPSRVPGGSSGGSAAAVAAGAVPLALGSDTGGSVRQPAAFCGVCGLRPTYGRVSRWGLVAHASSLDQVGPLTRSVRDLALADRVIAGPDRWDPTTVASPERSSETCEEPTLEGLRFGVVRELAPPPGSDPVFERALDRLAAAGARRLDLSVPNAAAAVACYTVLAACEASSNLARFDGIRFGRRAPDRPTPHAVDPLADLYRRSRSQGFGDEVKRRILLGTFALSAGHASASGADAYYRRAQGVRAALVRQLKTALERVDVLVGPTTTGGAFALGERTQDPRSMVLSDIWTTPAALAGLPALSIPSGLDDAGLPLALQLTARAHDEATLFRVGEAFETLRGSFPCPELAGVDSAPDPTANATEEAQGASRSR